MADGAEGVVLLMALDAPTIMSKDYDANNDPYVLKILLTSTLKYLEMLGFHQDIWNGYYCNACENRGGGTITPHKVNCNGVALYRTIKNLLDV